MLTKTWRFNLSGHKSDDSLDELNRTEAWDDGQVRVVLNTRANFAIFRASFENCQEVQVGNEDDLSLVVKGSFDQLGAKSFNDEDIFVVHFWKDRFSVVEKPPSGLAFGFVDVSCP